MLSQCNPHVTTNLIIHFSLPPSPFLPLPPSFPPLSSSLPPSLLHWLLGTNDKENFPNDFLLQIYDRIQQREFSTGRDHTHEVTEIRKQIIGSGCPVREREREREGGGEGKRESERDGERKKQFNNYRNKIISFLFSASNKSSKAFPQILSNPTS